PEPEKPKPKKPVRLEDAGTPPKVVRQDPKIAYPKEFRDQAIQGLVVVQCIITERGTVRACRLRSGPEELGDYVESVVKKWRYEPAEDRKGNPIAVVYTFRVPFKLR